MEYERKMREIFLTPIHSEEKRASKVVSGELISFGRLSRTYIGLHIKCISGCGVFGWTGTKKNYIGT